MHYRAQTQWSLNVSYYEQYQLLFQKLKSDISKDNAMPIYLQLHKSLREAIEQCIIKPGDFLPTERIVTEELHVSRITVRKAFLCLVQDNLVLRARGFGTQVKIPLSHSLSTINGFAEEIDNQNRVPGSIWIEKKKTLPTPLVSKKMNIRECEEIYKLERIGTIDEQLASYTTSYILPSVVTDINDIETSLYDYLRKQKLPFGRLSSTISASLADQGLCEKLKIPEKSAILVIKQTLLDREQQPLEYSISYFRSDLYEFLAESS
ncbi:GntR family transcriptional regulator [Serratia rhizosphaerae]|uniref:GntR family transcriptional regulator n=2 Tax=Serratia rhizosphaerae TaxID=2597702 RepID=A0ABX6GUR9_9GAMM|nr:GntR family transcriptional regulator [Serratia rhizosphaerae]